jgi:hypothetical protein
VNLKLYVEICKASSAGESMKKIDSFTTLKMIVYTLPIAAAITTTNNISQVIYGDMMPPWISSLSSIPL